MMSHSTTLSKSDVPEVKIGDYDDLLPRPSTSELKALEKSLLENGGPHEPLVVDEDGVIWDGIERFRICEEHDLSFEVRLISAETEVQKKRCRITINAVRRTPDDDDRRELARKWLQYQTMDADRVIAGIVGYASHTSVSELRRDMETAGGIEKVTHTRGADGKLRPYPRDEEDDADSKDDNPKEKDAQAEAETTAWTPPDPTDILVRVTMALTKQTSGQVDADAAAVPDAIQEIQLARSVWEAVDESPADRPDNLSLDEIDALSPGQLEVEWADPTLVKISRGGEAIAHVPVRRAARSDGSFIKGRGNTKTEGWMGILSSCSHGCFRRATGFPNCDVSCYTGPDGTGGCYVDHFPCNMRSEFEGSNVIANGLVNDLLRITLPVDGDPCLDDRVLPDRTNEIMTWRVDCESSTGDLSIGLGLLQVWAEANPTHRFTTICSNHIRPSDAMLAWLAALDNVVVGHSVSPWFSEEELQNRFAAIERFLEWGIPTVIWIVTDPKWDNAPVAERAVALVGPDRIIEEPHRRGHSQQCPPVLHINPAGSCSANRHDGEKRKLRFVTAADGGLDDYMVRIEDGSLEPPKGGVHSRCRGCTLRCGLSAYNMLERPRPSICLVDGDGQKELAHTPFPDSTLQWFKAICGDAKEHVRSLERDIHCVVTSPPSWQGTPYGDSDDEIGQESDAKAYIKTLCDLFDEISLHERGSLWVNLSDTRDDGGLHLIPERFAAEMGNRGWRLIDRVAWTRAVLQPDGSMLGSKVVSTAHRPLDGQAWQCLFRFSRSDDPWTDPRAVRVPHPGCNGERYLPPERMAFGTMLDGRTPPNAWLISPETDHPALLSPSPKTLWELPIAMTCPIWVNPDGSLPERSTGVVGEAGWTDISDGAEPGIVLDPFAGVFTTGEAALNLGRCFIGVDLYDRHCRMGRERLERVLADLCDRQEVTADVRSAS